MNRNTYLIVALARSAIMPLWVARAPARAAALICPAARVTAAIRAGTNERLSPRRAWFAGFIWLPCGAVARCSGVGRRDAGSGAAGGGNDFVGAFSHVWRGRRRNGRAAAGGIAHHDSHLGGTQLCGGGYFSLRQPETRNGGAIVANHLARTIGNMARISARRAIV